MSLCVLLLGLCARVAGAQTYIWTDERGVVHAASDPSEVPANQRAKSMRDAANRREVTPPAAADDSAGTPPAPKKRARSHSQEDGAPAAPTRSYEGDDPAETTGSGVGLDAKPEVTPPREPERKAEPRKADPDDDAKKPTGKGLPPPDPGFEWSCIPDPEGGPPKCEQFEKKVNKRERRAAARKKAREALGADDATDEFDPELAKKVNERAEQEYKKTTPVPKTKAPSRSEDDDEYGDDSGSSDEEDEN